MKSIEIIIDMECPTQGSLNSYIIKGRDGKEHINQVHSHEKEIKLFRKMVSEKLEPFFDEFYANDENVGYYVQVVAYGSKPKTVKRELPTVRGTRDLDKVLRAVLDALTYNERYNKFGAFKDDSQVVRLSAVKLYVNEENPVPVTKIKVTKVLLKTQLSDEFNDEDMVGEKFI